jgi:hypothetical protein
VTEHGAHRVPDVVGVFPLFTGIVEAVSYALLRQDKDGASYQDLAKIFE